MSLKMYKKFKQNKNKGTYCFLLKKYITHLNLERAKYIIQFKV